MGIRPMKVFALAWLVVGASLLVLIGPRLGWRGWIWLGIHEVLCIVGAGWELAGARFDPLFERWSETDEEAS